MESFDYKRLKSLLLDATSKAFAHILDIAAQERIYAFALYTSGELAYIVPTANSEEGLSPKAEEYAARYGDAVELHRDTLRWSPCDWKYHLEGEEFFIEVQKLLENSWQVTSGEPNYKPERVEEICISVLSEIKQQIEAKGLSVDGILFNLLMGDQSDEERIEFAKKVNSSDKVAKFRLELEQGAEAFLRLEQRAV